MGVGRLHHAGFDALPAARRHGGPDLQLVEPVRPPGQSGASSRGHHHTAPCCCPRLRAKPSTPVGACPCESLPLRRRGAGVTLTISTTHGTRDKARRAYVRIAGFLADLRKTAEQLDPLQRWYRILSEALRYFLKGRQLQPPLRLNPA